MCGARHSGFLSSLSLTALSVSRLGLAQPHNRYRDGGTCWAAGAPLPGFFWLFAIGELVSNKPCTILEASWSVTVVMANVETRRNELFLRMGAASEHIFYEEASATIGLFYRDLGAR